MYDDKNNVDMVNNSCNTLRYVYYYCDFATAAILLLLIKTYFFCFGGLISSLGMRLYMLSFIIMESILAGCLR